MGPATTCVLPRSGYRVLVNVGANRRGTAVMRPDVNQIKWE